MKKLASVSTVVILTVMILLYIQAQGFVPAQEQEKEILRDSCGDNVKKGRIDSIEIPEAGGSLPDLATESAGGYRSGALREEERKVLLAYAKYLQKYCEDYPYETNGIKYDLVFIDIDNIPELAIIPSAAHASGVILCAYNCGDVVEVGGFGSFGKCRFNSYENLIFSTYMGQGEEESSFYRLEGVESVELLALYSAPQYREGQYIGDYCEVDGIQVTEEEYRQVCEEWDWEKLNVWGYEDALLVSDTGDPYIELCRRLSSMKERKSMPQDDSYPEEWKQAYLSYMDAEGEYAAYCTYSLIHVDDDDIPELLIDTGSEAGGCCLLTFHDDAMDAWHSDRHNVTYIERGNLVCNSDGHFGHYYNNVYSIQDGKWVYVGGGTYGDGPDGVRFDENGDFIFVYNWNGEDVSGEEYQERLNALYSTAQCVYPQKYYILDEIRSVLRTGDVTSAKHRYELVVEDVTWKEAEMLCRERGGYLATLTSEEEFERIQEQIITEGKRNVTFFVGATNEPVEGTFRGYRYRWLEPGTAEGYDMMGLFNALLKPFWLEGKPSYRGLTENGVEVLEDCVVLLYRKADGRWYLNDVPNDILGAAPSYAGKVGYICEYD